MTGNPSPYDFSQARQAVTVASQNMKNAEDFTRQAYRDAAWAERAYRVALAERIVKLHADDVAWTVCQDLARGDKHVAELRYKRDVAEGVKEAAKGATWRHTADRRDLTELVNWSKRVAPDGQYDEPEVRSAA